VSGLTRAKHRAALFLSWIHLIRWPLANDAGSSENPMLVLISGILLLGGIGAFISWGLTHAYPAG